MTETFQVKSLEEMPRALTYLIEKVDSLQEDSQHTATQTAGQ